MQAVPKLYYWNIKARAQLPVLLFELGNVPFEWVKEFEWPGNLKAESPFGQLPFLDHGDFKLGQSMAIARFAARKADLSGDNDHDFAMYVNFAFNFTQQQRFLQLKCLQH